MKADGTITLSALLNFRGLYNNIKRPAGMALSCSCFTPQVILALNPTEREIQFQFTVIFHKVSSTFLFKNEVTHLHP